MRTVLPIGNFLTPTAVKISYTIIVHHLPTSSLSFVRHLCTKILDPKLWDDQIDRSVPTPRGLEMILQRLQWSREDLNTKRGKTFIHLGSSG